VYPHTVNKFADDTKLGGVANAPEGHAAIQKDLKRLEKWADKNLMKFNKGMCKVLHLWQNKSTRTCYGPAKKNFTKKDLDTKLNVRHQCALATKQANDILGCTRRSVAAGWGEMILHLY